MPVIYNKKVEYAYTDPGVKAHTISWAEYQALSEDDKMNGDLYFIPDKQPEGNPSRIWTKLGTDPLTTQADDVSGAVNELNSSKLNKSGGTITGSLSIAKNLDVKGYTLSDLNGYKKIPVVTAAGVLEIGKYIDMHSTAEDTSDYTFRLNNDTQGHLIATGTITQGSSRKIKENIEEFTAEEALKILQLNPIKFDYIKGSKNERGFIAEEVAEILPNLVTDEEGIEGTKEYIPASLNYIGLIPYLIKVVQLQQKQIDKLLDVTNS